MRLRRTILLKIYPISWAVLLSIFAWRTGPVFVRNVAAAKIATSAPTASIDQLLGMVLHVGNASDRFSRAVAQLPSTGTILFISPQNNDRWDFVYSAVCYLTWPRKVERMELKPGGDFSPAIPEQGATVVCGVRTIPSLPSQIAIGPDLIVLLAQPK